jgi:hypothetical protein
MSIHLNLISQDPRHVFPEVSGCGVKGHRTESSVKAKVNYPLQSRWIGYWELKSTEMWRIALGF